MQNPILASSGNDELLTAMAKDKPAPQLSWSKQMLRTVFKACAVCVNSRAAASLTVHSSCLALIGATIASPALFFSLRISSEAMIASSAAAGLAGLGLWFWKNGRERSLVDKIETVACTALGFGGVVASHTWDKEVFQITNHPWIVTANHLGYYVVPAAIAIITIGSKQLRDAALKIVSADISQRQSLTLAAQTNDSSLEHETHRLSNQILPWIAPYIKTASHVATIGVAILSTSYVANEMSWRHMTGICSTPQTAEASRPYQYTEVPKSTHPVQIVPRP